MPKFHLIRSILPLATLSLLVLLGGCFVRPTQPLHTVQTQHMVVQQPAQVVYSPPVVVQRPAVVVQRPATIVYRTAPVVYRQPSPVLTPVRVSVPSQVSHYNVGNQCVPGTTRQCYAYCGYGTQLCNADGRSWGSCIEGW